MNVIWNGIRWILGLTICVISLGGFASGDIGLAFFVLSLGLILLPPVTKALFKKTTASRKQNPIQQASPKSNIKQKCSKDFLSITNKNDGNYKTKMTISLNEENLIALLEQKQEQRNAEIKNYKYIPMQIQSQGIQLLESIHILNSTKNLDTLIGRNEFINKMYDDFVKAAHNKRYISDIQIAIDQYKTMYYDRMIKDFELKLLVKPSHENLNEYYTECLFHSFNSFYKDQMEQIDTLKREDAKERRKRKIIDIGHQTIFEFDKNGSNDERFKAYLKSLQDKLEDLGNFKNNPDSERQLLSLTMNNPIVINPKSSFEITLYNSDNQIVQDVTNILNNSDIWDKTIDLLPLFSLHDIRCKEVDEYILNYKPAYQNFLQKEIAQSIEYQNAGERDKEIIVEELKEKVIQSLPERASCDLITLFDYSELDISIDNELVKKYSFEVISKYFGLSHYENKIISHWERKSFEDLLKADLALSAEEIDQVEILKAQTLKTLNLICDKEEGHFKRKNKAIEYLHENKNLLNNVGKYIATRNLFKLKPLPNDFSHIDIDGINNYWLFLEEYINLIVETYKDSETNKRVIEGDNSWIKGFSIEKFEDLNSNFICLRAREECKKKYSRSNPPKLPFHVGCNCHLRSDV